MSSLTCILKKYILKKARKIWNVYEKPWNSIEKAKSFAKFSKCTYRVQKFGYLRFILKSSRVDLKPYKTMEIRKWPTP